MPLTAAMIAAIDARHPLREESRGRETGARISRSLIGRWCTEAAQNASEERT